MFEMNEPSVFESLFKKNVNEHVEKKSNGQTSLSYLSWAWAWAEVKKEHENVSYEIERFDGGLPYQYDPKTGYMVWTKVTIDDITHEMWLPVMDSTNRAMKAEPYTYTQKAWNKEKKSWEMVERTVPSATMFDINKTIMRCLTKNLAMFGLGLYIYAGEDLPEDVKEEPVDAPSTQDLEMLKALANEGTIDRAKVLAYYRVNTFEDLSKAQANEVMKVGYQKRAKQASEGA